LQTDLILISILHLLPIPIRANRSLTGGLERVHQGEKCRQGNDARRARCEVAAAFDLAQHP